MWNLVSKTAYLRTHSKTMLSYFSNVGACGSYTNILKEIKELPSLDDTIPIHGACIIIQDNCQNYGKKIYLDRVDNKVDVKVVTAFVTLYIESDNSQDFTQDSLLCLSPWTTDSDLKDINVENLKNDEMKHLSIFESERSKFIGSFLVPNSFQRRENDFVENCIALNSIDITLSKEDTQKAIRKHIEDNFDSSGFKLYGENRQLFEESLSESDDEEVVVINNINGGGGIIDDSDSEEESVPEDIPNPANTPIITPILTEDIRVMINEPILIPPDSINNMKKILDLLKLKYHIGNL
jgi:hypothetical protein